MVSLKRYYKINANSILESVIALTIISICLYIAILIFAAVFTPRTAPQFYNNQNKVNEIFYLSQLKNDSVLNENDNDSLTVEEEFIASDLKKITIQYKDSSKAKINKTFYIQVNEE